jgi:hypothetical protein
LIKRDRQPAPKHALCRERFLRSLFLKRLTVTAYTGYDRINVRDNPGRRIHNYERYLTFRVEMPVIALVESSLGSVDDGVFGSGFLNRFTIGFDLVGRQMYLAPNQLLRTEQPFDASGVGFRRTDRGYVVQVVLPGSPAARADLRVETAC